MTTEAVEQELIEKCAAYLQATYGEELVEYDILSSDIEEGNGKLTMECTVRAGATTSRWQKTFTFSGGNITNMAWRRLG